MLETDPVTLLVDENNDLVVTNGRTSLARGLDACVIGARTRIQLIQGEWFLNRNVGVPWLENDLVSPTRAILGQRFVEAKVRSEIRKAILRTPGIVAVTRLDVSFDKATRTVAISWQARTAFGETDLETLEFTA